MKRVIILLLAAIAAACLLYSCSRQTAAGISETSDTAAEAGAAFESVAGDVFDEYAAASTEGGVILKAGGRALPQSDGGVYYLTLSGDTGENATVAEILDGALYSVSADGCTLYIREDMENVSATALAEANLPLEILAASDGGVHLCSVIFTSLPVMQLTVGGEIGEEDSSGSMQLSSAGRSVASGMTIHVRGGSSKSFDKIGYKLKLKDESGEKTNLNLLDLRSDDDWILMPLYTDESKLRDKLALDLWAEIGARDNSLSLYMGSKVEYIELIVDGDYRGLYALATPVDGKQLNISGAKGEALFKIGDWDVPSANSLLRLTDAEEFDGISLVSPEPSSEAWSLLAEYIALVYNSDDSEFARSELIDLDSFVDYYILINVTAATDNLWKNTFLAFKQTANGQRVYIIPWDLDLSMGVTWDADAPLLWKYFPEAAQQELTTYSIERIWDNFPEAKTMLVRKWVSLRGGCLSDAAISARIDEMTALLNSSGAISRERERWSGGGYSPDGADYVRDFILQKLAWMDGFIADMT